LGKNKNSVKKVVIENQELVIAEKRIKSLTQKIMFRDKGKRGAYINELAKAKKERDLIVSNINRENSKLETNALKTYALEVQEKTEVLKKQMEELKERAHATDLRIDLYLHENTAKPKVENPIKIEKPSFDFIGAKIRSDNQERLKIAEHNLNRIQKKAKSKRGTAYGAKYASELQRTRNNLNLVQKDIEHEPILIEYKELRAEINYLEIVIVELEAKNVERQAEVDKRQKDNALLEKYYNIKGV